MRFTAHPLSFASGWPPGHRGISTVGRGSLHSAIQGGGVSVAGRHRIQQFRAARRALVIGTIPLAFVTACSNSSDQSVTAAGSDSSSAPTTSNAGNPPSTSHLPGPAPTTDSKLPRTAPPTSSTVQPGVVSSPSDRLFSHSPGLTQPGVTQPKPPALVPPAPDYVVPENFRAIPQNTQPAPPVQFNHLHAPQPVAPVAPIAPPPRTLRMGDFNTPAPEQVSDDVLNNVNTAAANTEAAIATGFNSVGINPNRSDKIAGATIAGVATGAAVGAAVAGIPVAVVGGVVGGALGAGVTAPTVAGIPLGIAGGAAIGAAAAGLPAAAVGAVVGGVVGGAVGATVGTAI